jgi:predicted nucleotidyltransferase
MGKKGVRIENIEQLSVVLRELDFDIYAAILFGSRARGDALEDSDWDLIIISDEFKGMPFPERGSFFLRKVPLRRFDLLCYTKEEFSKKSNEIGLKEALKDVVKVI